MKKTRLQKQLKNLTGVNYNIFSKTQQEILNKIYAKQNGAYFSIQYYTDINNKVSAPYKDLYNVTKLTTLSIRKGIKYENTKKVIEKRKSSGYTPSNKSQWFYHLDNTLVKHKKEDKYYIAAFPNINGKPSTIYMVNGKPISYENLKNMGIMQPSWENSEKPDFITIGLDKIIAVY